MGIIIRKAIPEDAYDYAVCHIVCWRAAYKGIISGEYLNNMSVEQMADNNRKSLSEPGIYTFYCVEFDDKMIGRLVLCESRDEDKPAAGEIAAMYLIDKYWDKGYGREMMEYSIAEMKRRGHNEVYLWVLEENARARQFYEKCGFSYDGTKKEINIDKPLIEMRYVRSL